MEILKTFRHEYKYVIPYGEMLNLRNKLEEKYLIKKPVDEPVGTPAKDLLDRLDLIKNFI